MSDVKILKSIDITSYTIMGTGIGVLFSVLASIILLVAIGILNAQSIGILAYIIPTLIVGTIMCSIYNRFAEGYLYNWLTKRMNPITFELKDGKEITKISTVPTALIASIITTILVILLCAVSIFIVPIILSSIVQTLMFSGQTVMAFYQVAAVIMQPSVIAMIIVGSFIITFVFTLIATYIYNLLGSKGKGIVLDLSKDSEMTSLNSINPLSLVIVLTVISLVFNIILAIISLVSGGDAYQALGNIVGGLINGVIGGGLLAIFYNFLATKLGKLKIELIDN